MNAKIDIQLDKIEAFCKKYQIVEFSFFGSVLRDDFRPDSDVDVLVKFAEEEHGSLLDLVRMESELCELLGRKVDIVEESCIRNPIRRRSIMRGKENVYAAA